MVVIEGHCDERGSEEYNLALGERRANAVKQYLVDSGVSGAQLDTVSFGESQAGRAGPRRVGLEVEPPRRVRRQQVARSASVRSTARRGAASGRRPSLFERPLRASPPPAA